MSDALWNRSLAVLEACREPACLFEFLESVWHLDNVTHIEDLKKEAISALHGRGTQLHENLTREASLEDIPDLRTFYDTWARLQTFIDLAGKSSIRSQLDPLVDKMKRADDLAKSKMNLAARIDRMLVVAKSLDESGDVPKEDLKTIILTLSRTYFQHNTDRPDLSAEHLAWIKHLCAGLSGFASELESSPPAATSAFMTLAEHFKLYLHGCGLEDTIAATKGKVKASLQTKEGLQGVRKALEAERAWFSLLLGDSKEASTLLSLVETHLKGSLTDQRRELQEPDSDFLFAAAYEKFEPFRTEGWAGLEVIDFLELVILPFRGRDECKIAVDRFDTCTVSIYLMGQPFAKGAVESECTV